MSYYTIQTSGYPLIVLFFYQQVACFSAINQMVLTNSTSGVYAQHQLCLPTALHVIGNNTKIKVSSILLKSPTVGL